MNLLVWVLVGRIHFLDGKSYFRLEDDYQPGNVLKMNPESIEDRAYNVELSNGRLVMFACLGYLAEEYVTKSSNILINYY